MLARDKDAAEDSPKNGIFEDLSMAQILSSSLAAATASALDASRALDACDVLQWPGVRDAVREGDVLRIVAETAEPVVRRLLDADPHLHELEVQRAGLADAFLEITRSTEREAA